MPLDDLSVTETKKAQEGLPLHRVLPLNASAAERAIAESTVLESPAVEVGCASLAGLALLSGEPSVLHTQPSAHESYDELTDGTPVHCHEEPEPPSRGAEPCPLRSRALHPFARARL